MKGVLSVLVSNNFGVTTRVTHLFTRRGYNIRSFTGGETERPDMSRLTIETESDTLPVEQIRRQLEKLEDVRKAVELKGEMMASRELVLVKTPCNDGDFGILAERISPYNARIIDLTEEAAIVEMTGKPAAVDEFIEYMHEEGIIEMCRSGISALGRGMNSLYQSIEV